MSSETDALEPDVVMTAIMGFNPQNYGQFRMAAEHGIGTMDLTKIKVVGKSIKEVQEKLVAPMHSWRWPSEAAKIVAWDEIWPLPAGVE